jgi:hypothetical protein
MLGQPARQAFRTGRAVNDTVETRETDGAPAAPDSGRASEIDARIDALLRRHDARIRTGGIWYFFSSGVFFMLVGAAALTAAYLTHYQAHSSFTFIMVVVGVAILLYGTGTQGAGNFDGSVGAARYRIGVAGGAGILAFAVAMGIVLKAPEIQRAFQIERKYVQLVFQGERDGISDLSDYVSDVRVNGNAVPTFRSGDSIVAFVPFVHGDDRQKLFLSADFYYVGPPEARNKALLARIPYRDELPASRLRDIEIAGGGDFPRYDQPVTIRMVAETGASVVAVVDPPAMSGEAPPPPLAFAE